MGGPIGLFTIWFQFCCPFIFLPQCFHLMLPFALSLWAFNLFGIFIPRRGFHCVITSKERTCRQWQCARLGVASVIFFLKDVFSSLCTFHQVSCFPSSSASVERLWSMAGTTQQNRERLTESRFHEELFMKWNLRG